MRLTNPYTKELMQPNLPDFFHTQIAHATVFALICGMGKNHVKTRFGGLTISSFN